MRNKMKQLLTLFMSLIFCVSMVGCDFVVREQRVLMDAVSPEGDSSDSTDSADSIEKVEASDTQTEKTETVVSDDKTTNNHKDEPAQNQTVAGNKEPQLSGALEIQIFTNESASVSEAWTNVIDEFEENTGVKVTAYIGSQVNTQFTKRWMSPNPPDIALLMGSGIPDVALESSGALYDMTDLLKTGYVYGTNEKIWDVVNHNMFQQSSTNAGYYRAGFMAEANGIFYDSAYLKKVGLSAPTNYNELKKFVSSSTTKGIATFTTTGTSGNYACQSMIMPALAAYGQKYLDGIAMGKASSWKTSQVRDVFQRWHDFCNTEGALLTGTATLDHTTSQMKWLNHNSLLIGNGIWLPWEVENNTPASFKMTFGTSPLILKEQKPTVMASPISMIVAKQGKNLENAKAFVRFLYAKKSQEELAGTYGYIGARKDMDYTNVPGISTASKTILSHIYSSKVQICWRRYIWGDLNDTVNAAVHGLMTGSMNVDQAVKTITNRAK